MIDWNDPEARFALIQRVGVSEYCRLQQQHRDRQMDQAGSTVATLSGRVIKRVKLAWALCSQSRVPMVLLRRLRTRKPMHARYRQVLRDLKTSTYNREDQKMLLGLTLAISGGSVALCAGIVLALLGDPERDKRAKLVPGIKWGIGTTGAGGV